MIGAVILAYRDAHGLSVRDLAKILNISPATVSRIENGHPCEQATMLKILNWLFQ